MWGTVEMFDKFCAGLQDLEGFSHIILLYHFHLSQGFNLQVVPFMDTRQRGLFATRAPNRPNPVGLSIVHLSKIDGNVLHIQNVDILDSTPLLDIKPFVPKFDVPVDARAGWIDKAGRDVSSWRSDKRFK